MRRAHRRKRNPTEAARLPDSRPQGPAKTAGGVGSRAYRTLGAPSDSIFGVRNSSAGCEHLEQPGVEASTCEGHPTQIDATRRKAFLFVGHAPEHDLIE